MKKISVIIINYNTASMTERVIRNLFDKKGDFLLEVILIDNCSGERFPIENLKNLEIGFIQNQENKGFAKAVNQGIDLATGNYILLLNSDVLVADDTLSTMMDCLEEDASIGIVGPQMVFPNNKFQSSFGVIPSLKSELLRFSQLFRIFPGSTFTVNTLTKKINLDKTYLVDWLSGGCMLIRKNVIDIIGKMDEDYFLGVEDIDFCYRTKLAGLKTIYCPTTKVIHYHGYSSGKDGARSVKRIEFDRDGLDIFFSKHFQNKKLTRVVVRLMHDFKIRLIKFL